MNGPHGLSDLEVQMEFVKREGARPWRWLCLLSKHEWEVNVCCRCKAEREFVTVLELQRRINRDFKIVGGTP